MTQTATLPTCSCLRCGHDWHPRSDATPIRCPKCKSPYWNVPRRSQNQT